MADENAAEGEQVRACTSNHTRRPALFDFTRFPTFESRFFHADVGWMGK